MKLLLLAVFSCGAPLWAHSVLFCRTSDRNELPYYQITITPAEVGEIEFTVRVITRKDDMGREIEKSLVQATGEVTSDRFYIEVEDGPRVEGKRQGNGHWKSEFSLGEFQQEMHCKKK